MKWLWPVLGLALVGRAYADEPIPAAPTSWITDQAGFLSASARTRLDARLEQYERQTGRQFIVWIGTTTGRVPLEEWTVRAFERWRPGHRGLDNGLALFVFAADRKVRIEVGYGLEPIVTDAQASRVIRDTIVPPLRAGRRDEAVEAGVDRLLELLGQPARGQREAKRAVPAAVRIVAVAIVGVLFLILLVTNPTLAFYLLARVLTGGRGGGGPPGFHGGGGRSGGGGASGSW